MLVVVTNVAEVSCAMVVGVFSCANGWGKMSGIVLLELLMCSDGFCGR
jgi:hypothetical protein